MVCSVFLVGPVFEKQTLLKRCLCKQYTFRCGSFLLDMIRNLRFLFSVPILQVAPSFLLLHVGRMKGTTSCPPSPQWTCGYSRLGRDPPIFTSQSRAPLVRVNCARAHDDRVFFSRLLRDLIFFFQHHAIWCVIVISSQPCHP